MDCTTPNGNPPARSGLAMTEAVWEAARTLWRYMRLTHPPQSADFILCMGSFDLRVPTYAATLYRQGWAPRMVVSGGLAHVGELMDTGWQRPEADVFAEQLRADGVPDGALILEDQATNTGENFARSRLLLERLGIPGRSCLAVTKPYMTRRAYATGRRVWPDLRLRMWCEATRLDDYLADDPHPERTLHAMVGDFQRMRIYPDRGFQIPQRVPRPALQAARTLAAAGYTQGLLPGEAL